MQPCKTGDQPYSDASPNGECSLERGREDQIVFIDMCDREREMVQRTLSIWGRITVQLVSSLTKLD